MRTPGGGDGAGRTRAGQHEDSDPICVKVFEEKVSGTLEPALKAALDYVRPGDTLTVAEADRLGRNLLEGLIVLNDVFERGVAVTIVDGIAVGGAHRARA